MTSTAPPGLRFVDLQAQRRRLDGRIEAAIAGVLAHGQFILGPEVEQLERALAVYAGVRHAITCASGTDALVLVLMAQAIGPGDAVFVPGFTFAACAAAVALVGATPVLVDVEPASGNLDPVSVGEAIAAVRQAGRLAPRAILPVDLFGRPADYAALGPIARAHGLFVLQDAAQSFGARWGDQPVGRQGHAAATSFYPAKPLGAYGDGGAVLTDDDRLADEVRLRRTHGERRPDARYDHVRIGLNSRLDTLQAAILLVKLEALDEEIARRERACGALRCRPRRPGRPAAAADRRPLGLGPIHHPGERARPAGGGARPARHPDRGPLPATAASAAGVRAFPDRARRPAGRRDARPARAQPADPPGSRAERPGADHRRDPRADRKGA